jgi:hypothetical protein
LNTSVLWNLPGRLGHDGDGFKHLKAAFMFISVRKKSVGEIIGSVILKNTE